MEHYEKLLPQVSMQASERRGKPRSRTGDSEAEKVEYMKRHIGEEYEGVISGITKWGVCRTFEYSGRTCALVNMQDDHYEYREEQYDLIGTHTRHVYKLGQTGTGFKLLALINHSGPWTLYLFGEEQKYDDGNEEE